MDNSLTSSNEFSQHAIEHDASTVAGAMHSTNDVLINDDRRTASVVHDEMLNSVLDSLHYAEVADPADNHQTLYEAYLDGVARLDNRRSELCHVITTLKRTFVEFRLPNNIFDEARSACNKMLDEEYSFDLGPIANRSSSALAALPVDELRERFRAALRDEANRLVQQFIAGLDNFVDRQIVGLAAWPNQNGVTYHFFKRLIRLENQQDYTTRHVERRDPNDDPDDNWRRWKRVTKRIKSADCVCVMERHTHDAINAFYTSLENTLVVIPHDVEMLVEAIPDWMRPSIRVIDGYLVGERVRSVERNRSEVVSTTTTETPIHGHEPAILLGPYVLAGWGPRVIEEATRQKHEEQSHQRYSDDRLFWGGTAIAAQVLAAAFFLFSANPLAFLMALACYAAGIVAATLSIKDHFLYRGERVPEWRLQAITLGLALFCLGLQLFLMPLGWIKLVLALACLAAGSIVLYPNRDLLRD